MGSRGLEGFAPGGFPEGWHRMRIGEAIKEVSSPTEMRDDEEYLLASIRRRFGGMFHRERLFGREILTKTLQRVVPGCFVIARMQIVHGACALADEQFENYVISKSYSSFESTEHCDTRYFSKLAEQPFMTEYFRNASQGVVIEKMTFQQDRWLGFPVCLPPVEEQRRIAEILDTIDETIQATERVIAKRKRIRAGLAASLLSGRSDGVPTEDWKTNETPPPPASTSTSRNSGMGESWSDCQPHDVMEHESDRVGTDWAYLSDLAEVNPRSPSPTDGETVSFVAMADVSESGVIDNLELRKASTGYTPFAVGDVLVAKITPCFENGKGAHVRGLPTRCGLGSTEFHVLRPRSTTSDRYLYHLTRTSQFRRQGEGLMSGSAGQRRVPTEFFSRYAVRMPPLEEQRRIAEILDTIDETVQANEQQRDKLRRLRSGLASDLLSGRVLTVAA